MTIHGFTRRVCEWTFELGRVNLHGKAAPFDVRITDPFGVERAVPGFVTGSGLPTVRYSSSLPGTHRYRVVADDAAGGDDAGPSGTIELAPYSGEHPLYRRGAIVVAPDRRRFMHEDGTPFLWLGDTWWMSLTKRLTWPEEFEELLDDRRSKGFSVLQIVMGLYPDMPAFDERGANEAGQPWEEDYSDLRHAYFDMADLRIRKIVDAGLVPCIVGCWGYHLPWLGEERMKLHWRNLVARYGAYPVVWCLAGEGSMPYYLSKSPEEDRTALRRGWTVQAEHLRAVDPFHRPITIHPSSSARETLDDPSLLDFDMLQTGHGGRASLPNNVRSLVKSVQTEPPMPALVGEPSYEGIFGESHDDVQRFSFWSCMLSGAAGHTYGANGIWQMNRKGAPYGPSPHGRNWGSMPWREAMRLPGSTHLGVGRRILESLPWSEMKPHPEWIDPHWNPDNVFAGYAAGIPERSRIFYLPPGVMWNQPVLREIEAGVSYAAAYVNPSTGERTPIGTVTGGETGEYRLPFAPEQRDWVVVMERLHNEGG